MRIAVMMVAVCLIVSPVSAFDGGWGERYQAPGSDYSPLNDPLFSTPTTREPVDPYDFLPRGHEEAFQREYENRQEYMRRAPCANSFDNNPARKAECWESIR